MPITLEEYHQRLDELLKGELRETVTRIVVKSAVYGEGRLKTHINARLRTRSARLVRSAAGDVLGGDNPGVRLSVGGPGQAVPYAGAQEAGATIMPRRGRYLAIPFPGGPALTPAGVPRYPNARAAGPLILFRAKSGRMMLGKRVGDRMQAWYILHPGPIQIPAKRFLEDATRETSDYMVRQLTELVAEQLQEVGGD